MWKKKRIFGKNIPEKLRNFGEFFDNHSYRICSTDADKIKDSGSGVKTNDIKSFAEIELSEKDKMKEKDENIQ